MRLVRLPLLALVGLWLAVWGSALAFAGATPATARDDVAVGCEPSAPEQDDGPSTLADDDDSDDEDGDGNGALKATLALADLPSPPLPAVISPRPVISAGARSREHRPVIERPPIA